MKNTATSKKEYADLDKASQTIDDYLVSLRDEPEQKRKKGELEQPCKLEFITGELSLIVSLVLYCPTSVYEL